MEDSKNKNKDNILIEKYKNDIKKMLNEGVPKNNLNKIVTKRNVFRSFWVTHLKPTLKTISFYLLKLFKG